MLWRGGYEVVEVEDEKDEERKKRRGRKKHRSQQSELFSTHRASSRPPRRGPRRCCPRRAPGLTARRPWRRGAVFDERGEREGGERGREEKALSLKGPIDEGERQQRRGRQTSPRSVSLSLLSRSPDAERTLIPTFTEKRMVNGSVLASDGRVFFWFFDGLS